MEKVKMLKQESVVKQAQQDLKDLENKLTTNDLTDDAQDENVSEEMKQFEDSVITGDQLAQIRALYNRRPKQLVRKYKKIGRNDRCPCGSGKKYKNCCMNTNEYEGLKEIKNAKR